MGRHIRAVVWNLASLVFLAGCSAFAAPTALATAESAPVHHSQRVLIYTNAVGFVHKSIPVGVEAIRRLGAANGFAVDVTADPEAFNTANLAKYKALIFLSTTGNVLPTESQRFALENYIRHRGGYFGIHAAADMGALASTWPFYLNLVGAAFKGHTNARLYSDTPIPPRPGVTYGGSLASAPADADFVSPGMKASSSEAATIVVEDKGSPAMLGWGSSVRRIDEWYGFKTSPRPRVHVIASLDESSYDPAAGAMGDHPIAWCHSFAGGRSVYTGLGHPSSVWSDRQFLGHILGGIKMAMGTVAFSCR